MEQLTEMDYSFVQMESNRTPLHITPVMFYDQSTAPGGKAPSGCETTVRAASWFPCAIAAPSTGSSAPETSTACARLCASM